MSILKIFFIHVGIFVILTLVLLLTSEQLLNYFASGIHGVGMWISLMIYGTIAIFLLVGTSCLFFMIRAFRRQERAEKTLGNKDYNTLQ